jgi:hypothetical protein
MLVAASCSGPGASAGAGERATVPGYRVVRDVSPGPTPTASRWTRGRTSCTLPLTDVAGHPVLRELAPA